MICCAIKTLYPFCDETIVGGVCDFSNQDILSKMMLDAYRQPFITHSGLTSCIIRGIFTGMETILNRIIAYIFYICKYFLSLKR